MNKGALSGLRRRHLRHKPRYENDFDAGFRGRAPEPSRPSSIARNEDRARSAVEFKRAAA